MVSAQYSLYISNLHSHAMLECFIYSISRRVRSILKGLRHGTRFSIDPVKNLEDVTIGSYFWKIKATFAFN